MTPAAPVHVPVDPHRFENIVGRVMPAIVLVEASGGRGSGFFVAPDTLLTNVHVVGRNSAVTVRRASGDAVSARVEATAPQVDIAVLKVSAIDKTQPVLTLGIDGKRPHRPGGLRDRHRARHASEHPHPGDHQRHPADAECDAGANRRRRESGQQRRAADRSGWTGARHRHDGIHRAAGIEFRGRRSITRGPCSKGGRRRRARRPLRRPLRPCAGSSPTIPSDTDQSTGSGRAHVRTDDRAARASSRYARERVAPIRRSPVIRPAARRPAWTAPGSLSSMTA